MSPHPAVKVCLWVCCRVYTPHPPLTSRPTPQHTHCAVHATHAHHCLSPPPAGRPRSVTVEDVCLATGEPCEVAVYSTREAAITASPAAAHEGADADGSQGAVLWLPHGVALQLHVVPPGGAAALAAAGLGGGKAVQAQPGAARRAAARNGNGSSGGGAASPSSESSADECEGPALPGLAISVLWAPVEGTVVSLTRWYSGRGELERVVAGTAIRDA